MELDPSYLGDLKLKFSHTSTEDKEKTRRSKAHSTGSPRAAPSTRGTPTVVSCLDSSDNLTSRTNNTIIDGKTVITNSNVKSSSNVSSARIMPHAADSRTPFAVPGMDAGSSSSSPTSRSPSSNKDTKDDVPTITVQPADKDKEPSQSTKSDQESKSESEMTEAEEAVLNGRRMASHFASVSAQLVKNANQLRTSSLTTAKLVKTIDGQVADLTRISMGVAYHNRILPEDQRTELDMTSYNAAIEVLDIIRKDKMSGVVV